MIVPIDLLPPILPQLEMYGAIAAAGAALDRRLPGRDAGRHRRHRPGRRAARRIAPGREPGDIVVEIDGIPIGGLAISTASSGPRARPASPCSWRLLRDGGRKKVPREDGGPRGHAQAAAAALSVISRDRAAG